MNQSNATLIGYSTLAILNAILMQFAVELGAGRVPIPDAWRWAVPIASAGLVALTALLPRLRAGDTAPVARVDVNVGTPAEVTRGDSGEV